MNIQVQKGWPKDARIAGLHADEETYSFTVIVESKEFEVVKTGGKIPFGEIIVQEAR